MAENHFDKYREELNKLNLETIDDLENLVKPLIRDATKINIKRQEKMPKNTQLISQFGGYAQWIQGAEITKRTGYSFCSKLIQKKKPGFIGAMLE